MTDGPADEGQDDAVTRRSYHHGRLKEALIEAARNLIEQKGPQGFSLTEAARMVGVTPAAPYRHFSDREALMGEVARRGFDLFNERLRNAWGDGQPDAADAFSRMGRAYLDFAREEPGYYRSMFTRAVGGEGESPPDARAQPTPSSQSFDLLGQAARAVLQDRGRADVDACRLALTVWALAHGVATLMLGGYLPEEGRSDAYNLLNLGVKSMIDGA